MPLDEGATRLGKSLLSAVSAYTQIGAQEAQLEAQRRDIAVANQAYLDFFDNVETLRQQYGDSLTKNAIYRRAWDTISEKYAYTGLPLSTIQNMINSEGAAGSFTTEADYYIKLAAKHNVLIDENTLADPIKKEEMINFLKNAERVDLLEAQEKLTETEANIYYENVVNLGYAGLANNLTTINNALTDFYQGSIDINKVLNIINEQFYSTRDYFRNSLRKFSQQDLQNIGKNLYKEIENIENKRLQYTNIIYNIYNNKLKLETSQSEAEQAKYDTELKRLQTQRKIEEETMKLLTYKNPSGRKLFILKEMLSGLGIPPTYLSNVIEIANNVLDIFSDSKEFQQAIDIKIQNLPQYNTLADIVETGKMSKENVVRALNAASGVLKPFIGLEAKYAEGGWTDEEVRNYVREVAVIMMKQNSFDLLLHTAQFLETAYEIYPDIAQIPDMLELFRRVLPISEYYRKFNDLPGNFNSLIDIQDTSDVEINGENNGRK